MTTFILSNDVAASGLGTPGRPPQMVGDSYTVDHSRI